MMRLVRRGAAAFALVLLAGGQVHGPALAQNERPDLKIEVVGLNPNNSREVKILVTNVGQWWADTTTAAVEAVPATAGAKDTETVPDLDPRQQPQGPTDYKYEFTYTLAAACSGQKVEVKASLAAAKTFNGNAETNTGDNAHTREVCPGASPGSSKPFDPAASGIEVTKRFPGIENVDLMLPERERVGVHADAAPDKSFDAELLDPSVARRHGLRRQNDGALGCLPPPGGGGLMIVGDFDVGYRFMDGFGCDVNYVFQFIVNFDLEWLRGIEKKSLSKAELLFDENAHARNDDGEPVTAATCIGRLGLAPADYPAIIGRQELLPSTPVEGDRLAEGPGVTSRWDVTKDIRWVSSAHNEPLVGFVLHGLDDNLGAETDRGCASMVTNVRLKLEYTVLR